MTNLTNIETGTRFVENKWLRFLYINSILWWEKVINWIELLDFFYWIVLDTYDPRTYLAYLTKKLRCKLQARSY